MRRISLAVSAPLLLSVCGDSTVSSPITSTIIVSVTPVPNAISAARSAEIVVTFANPIDRSTVDARSFAVFGRWSGVIPGTITYEDGDARVRFTPTRPFAAGEWVTASLARTIENADGTASDAGFAWGFFVRAERGSLDLVRVGTRAVRQPGEGHIQTYGAYAGDLDSDGYPDLMVPNEQANDVRIFLNNRLGDYGAFTVYAAPGASFPSTNEGGDFDGDGVLDFAVGSGGNSRVNVFFGTGAGAFEHRQGLSADRSVRGLCVADFNGDGWMDIATANRQGEGDGNVTVFLNDAAGRFPTRHVVQPGGEGETTCAVADANGDGIPDLFIGALNSSEVILLVGDGNGGFTVRARANAGGTPWMIAAGDVNGDGNVDVVTANNSQATVGVVLGDGRGGLTFSSAFPVGDTPLAVDLGDVDGDGDLDLVSSNYTSADFTLLENTGTGAFRNPRIYASGRSGSCAIIHDRDGDGDLDITGIDELDDILILFENR